MSQAALDRANRILRRIEPLIYARRGLTMAILLVITAVLGWQASKIRPDAGFDTVTLALEMAAPLGSVTVPSNWPF